VTIAMISERVIQHLVIFFHQHLLQFLPLSINDALNVCCVGRQQFSIASVLIYSTSVTGHALQSRSGRNCYRLVVT